MRNTYRTLYFVSAILLVVFGSLVLTGCTAKQAATEQQTATTEQTATREQETPGDRSASGHLPNISEEAADIQRKIAATKKVTIKELLGTPASYLGEEVQVYAEIYKIEMLPEGTIGASAIVRISPPDDFSAEVLKCEFPQGRPPASTLEEGQRVTIFGKVDAIEGTMLLRNCFILN